MIRCNKLNRQLLFLRSIQSQVNNQVTVAQQRLSDSRSRIDTLGDILFPPVILLSSPVQGNDERCQYLIKSHHATIPEIPQSSHSTSRFPVGN